MWSRTGRSHAERVSSSSLSSVSGTVVLAVVLAACRDGTITDPRVIPDAPALAVSGGGVQLERVKVCKDDSNVPAGTTFQYSVSTSANPVTVTAGQCVVVLTTGQLKQVTISELPKAGFTLDSVKRNTGSGLQLAADPVTCSASGTTGCVVVYYNHKNAPVITYSGEATVVKAKVLLGAINATLVKAGPLATTGGSDQATLLTANIPGLLTATLLDAQTSAGGGSSQSSASIADVRLGLKGISLSADVIESKAQAVCSNGSESVSGYSKITRLWINGLPVIVTGHPNQTIYLLVGKVIINEQIKTGDSITVNAIHVIVPLAADVVISQAHADIHCS